MRYDIDYPHTKSDQEFSAQRSATALQKLVTTISKVLREGDAYEVDAVQLVPRDIVILVSGDRIPAASCAGAVVGYGSG